MGHDQFIQVVHAANNPLGSARQDDVQRKGLWPRVVRVMVEDKDGNVLVQKRQSDKQIYPDCWDKSAAGHVDVGEEYAVAAERELFEEVGISGYRLEEVGYYKTEGAFGWRILRRWNRMYRVILPHDIDLTLQTGEVSSIKWLTRLELRDFIVNHPSEVSDDLIEAHEMLYIA